MRSDCQKRSMTEIQFQINNHPNGADSLDADLVCIEHLEHLENIISTSVVVVTAGTLNLKIRFDWKEQRNELSDMNFLYVPETNVLFFKSQNQWGAIDIASGTLKRHENAQWLPYIERKCDYILIEDDLSAESTTLNAETIHSIPIDPPTESKEFNDRIEYHSPVFGHQILRTK